MVWTIQSSVSSRGERFCPLVSLAVEPAEPSSLGTVFFSGVKWLGCDVYPNLHTSAAVVKNVWSCISSLSHIPLLHGQGQLLFCCNVAYKDSCQLKYLLYSLYFHLIECCEMNTLEAQSADRYLELSVSWSWFVTLCCK